MILRVGWDKKGRGSTGTHTINEPWFLSRMCGTHCSHKTWAALPTPFSASPFTTFHWDPSLALLMACKCHTDDFLHAIFFLAYSAKDSIKTKLKMRKTLAERQLNSKFSWLRGKQNSPHCATPKILAWECQPCQGNLKQGGETPLKKPTQCWLWWECILRGGKSNRLSAKDVIFSQQLKGGGGV